MRDFDAFHALLTDRQDKPFRWGPNDCVTFAVACIRAQTKVNRLRGIGRWRSQLGAARALKRHGGLDAAVSAVLTEVPIAFAMRGDVVAVIGPGGPALMVIEGDLLVGPGLGGLIRLPRAMAVKAWSAE